MQNRPKWFVSCHLIVLALALGLLLGACAPVPEPRSTDTATIPAPDVTTPATAPDELPLPTLEPGVPTLQFNGKAEGCGDVFVYKSNAATTEYITAWISGRTYGLSSEEMVFDLAESGDDLRVVVDVYVDAVRNVGEFPYCNDIAPWAEPVAQWQAVAGTAAITLSTDPPEFNCIGEPYQATVHLRDLVLTDGEHEMTLDAVEFENVTVGWCAG